MRAKLACAGLITAFCWIGCASPPEPEYIADTELAEVISKLYLAEANRKAGRSYISSDSVLALYKLTGEQFDKVIESLADDPERLVTVYDSVIVLLTADQAE